MIDQWIQLFFGVSDKFLGLSAWLLVAMVVMVPIERVAALHPQKFFRKGFWRDLGYYFVSGIVPSFILVLTLGFVSATGRILLPTAWFEFGAQLPIWLRVSLMVIVGEFGFYWAHRWAHEWPSIWQFHAIHHSATEMDWLVNTKSHPMDVVFNRTVSFVPLFFLGLVQPQVDAPDPNLVAVIAFNTVWAFFVHANVRWRLGSLEYLVTTPAFHHWHHANDNPSVLNKNYAALFPIVDRLFGTHYLPKGPLPQQYGTDTRVTDTLLAALLHPVMPDMPSGPEANGPFKTKA